MLWIQFNISCIHGASVGVIGRCQGVSAGQRPRRSSPTDAALTKYGSGTRKQFPPRPVSKRMLQNLQVFQDRGSCTSHPHREWMMYAWLASATECGRSLEKVSQEEMWIPSGIEGRSQRLAGGRFTERTVGGSTPPPTPTPGGPTLPLHLVSEAKCSERQLCFAPCECYDKQPDGVRP